MSDNVGAIGTMCDAFFQPKRKLLEWLQRDFDCSIGRLEDCANGAIYLQILDAAYPGKIPMQKVTWNAVQSYDMTKNYKLLQEVLPDCGLVRSFDIAHLISRRQQDLLELLQWMKHVYDRRMEQLPENEKYRAAERRALGHGPLPDWCSNSRASSAGAKGLPLIPSVGGDITSTSLSHKREASNSVRHYQQSAGSTRQAPSVKSNLASGLRKASSSVAPAQSKLAAGRFSGEASVVGSKAQAAKIEELEREIKELKDKLDDCIQVKDFFLNKLKALEFVCVNNTDKTLEQQTVLDILYSETLVEVKSEASPSVEN